MAQVPRTIPKNTLRRRRQYFSGVRSQLRERKVNLLGSRACEVCAEHSEDMVLHHILPLAMGGPNTLENLMLMCPACHKELHRRMAEEYQKMI